MLRPADGGRAVPHGLLLLDTGADITLVPWSAVERLGVPPLPDLRYELMAFDGTTSFVPAAALDMVLLSRVFRGRYLLIDQEHGVLGRDVLNHAVVLHDGPRQRWAEHVAPKPPASQ